MADDALVNAFGDIGVVLPQRERFSLANSGAVALCARDFAFHSRFRERIRIMGAAECEYPDVRYLKLTGWRRWWRRRRTAYAEAVAQATQGFALVEVQNRPYMIDHLRRRSPEVKLALYLLNDPQEMAGSRDAAERRRLLEIADAIWCISGWVRRRFLDQVDDDRGRVSVVFAGVDADPPRASKEKIVAFVGRILPIKGAEELARAFARASPQMPGWRLVVAGADTDGLLTRWRVELGDKIDLLGQVSNAQAMALFARAEIAVAPSVWQEPFGRVAIEALANGCALVTSGRGGLAEIAEGVAEIVDPTDIEAFACVLVKLASEPGRREEMRLKSAARIRTMFDIGLATARLDAERARLLGL